MGRHAMTRDLQPRGLGPVLGQRRTAGDRVFHGLDDVPGRDAVAIDQLVGLAAARDLVHREPPDAESRGRNGLADGAARRARG